MFQRTSSESEWHRSRRGDGQSSHVTVPAIRSRSYGIFEYGQPIAEIQSGIFQALSHPTRIAIVDLLRGGELSASQIVEELGLEQANASQHLAVLRTRQIVVSRKTGNQVFYSLRDPVLLKVLDLLRDYFYSQLSDNADMLKELLRSKAVKR